MKVPLSIHFSLWLFAASLHAADVPTSNVPSAASRLASARAAIEARDWSRALMELDLAAREAPRNAEVHNLLGYSYRKQAQPNLPKAFEHYRRALALDPRHRGAHEYIGEAYLMDKKPQEAERHLAELERICGTTAARNTLTWRARLPSTRHAITSADQR